MPLTTEQGEGAIASRLARNARDAYVPVVPTTKWGLKKIPLNTGAWWQDGNGEWQCAECAMEHDTHDTAEECRPVECMRALEGDQCGYCNVYRDRGE